MKLLFFLILLSSALLAKDLDFNLIGHDGNSHSLKTLKGKIVVLEWFNHGCPFVRKHYDSKNMQNLQKKYKNKVVWFTINSSNVDKQGYLKDEKAAAKIYELEGMNSRALLIDTAGRIGQKYNAKTTPNMYVINAEGKLVYEGAIDSIASANDNDIKKARNYVDETLSKLIKNEDVSYFKTKPYGCSIKY
jgi:cytochrome oxidase Cu insertion factor (SCO1/SenC/PrrC family)